MSATNNTRRSVMLMAWVSKRAEPTRSFADCLRGAWRFEKRAANSAAKFRRLVRPGVRIDFSRSLIRSPASNRHGLGTTADRQAGQSISRVSR
jgi:hypothetical protein